MKLLKLIITITIVITLIQACTPAPPQHLDNICSIFKEYPNWYWAAKKTQKKWGVPISTQMAIIHQESRFNGTAKPPRQRVLWVIPWKRPTSAVGYSQALRSTWDNYKKRTHNGGANRNDFADASDFIGWYSNRLHKKAGVKLWDSYHLYLAYHEGGGGYIRGTYKHKAWLLHVAKKVQSRAYRYHLQLNKCKNKIKKTWWAVF